MADAPAPSERALAELRRELRGAVGALEDLSDDGVGSQARRLLAAREAREALVRAQRTIDSQDEALRELAQTVTTLARQLLESHARFSEWMLTHGEPSSGPEGPR